MAQTERLDYTYFDSPIGALLIAGTPQALHFISFPTGSKAFLPRPEWIRNDGGFREVERQLGAYFAGELRTFDLPIVLQGTGFQRQVWTTLPEVPFGETTSYGALARMLNRPDASRAVGAANGANPIPIVLPCHRVIGANGSLTGFGGGIAVKQYLLAHEARVVGAMAAQLALF